MSDTEFAAEGTPGIAHMKICAFLWLTQCILSRSKHAIREHEAAWLDVFFFMFKISTFVRSDIHAWHFILCTCNMILTWVFHYNPQIYLVQQHRGIHPRKPRKTHIEYLILYLGVNRHIWGQQSRSSRNLRIPYCSCRISALCCDDLPCPHTSAVGWGLASRFQWTKCHSEWEENWWKKVQIIQGFHISALTPLGGSFP